MAKGQIKSDTVKRIAKAFGGLSEEMSEARIKHIVQRNNLSGQTTQKMAEGILNHMDNSKYVKVKNIKDLKVFGKAYADNVTEFAEKEFGDTVRKNLKNDRHIIANAKEHGIKIGEKKMPTRLDIVSSTGDTKVTQTQIPRDKNLSDRKKSFQEYNQKKESFYKEQAKTQGNKKTEPKIEADGLNGKKPEAMPHYDSRELKGKMYDSEEGYMKYKAAKEHDEALKILGLKDAKPNKFEEQARNNPILDALKGDKDGYGHITKEQIENARIEAIQNASADQMGLTDRMGYHKVPQKAAAGVGTFWLVNKLASNNGQQTNAQLYGQQPYY